MVLQVFVKNTPAGIQQLTPRHYSKSTLPSNHANMFELPQDARTRKVQVSKTLPVRRLKMGQQPFISTAHHHISI